MKNIVFGALFLMIPVLITSAQSFEGKIVYQNTYKSKMPSVNDDQFKTMMGDRQEFYAKGPNYKSVMNGTMMKWQLYLAKDNRLYNKMAMQDALLYNEGSVYNDSIISYEINKGVTEILGYSCDELILTTQQGTQKFYYNPVTKIDAELFKAHKFGNWGGGY